MTRPLGILFSSLLLLSAACGDDADTPNPTKDSGVAKDMAAQQDKGTTAPDTSTQQDKGTTAPDKGAVTPDKGAVTPDKGIATPDSAATFTLTSTAFADKAAIPQKHSYDGADVSPALAWTGAPAGTKSFALIVDDPDPPGGSFIHWLLYDMDPTTTSLSEGVARNATVTGVGNQGITGFGKVGYWGPCPPSGTTHNYKFMLYALGKKLNLMAGATHAQLTAAITGNSLGMVTLTGTYKR